MFQKMEENQTHQNKKKKVRERTDKGKKDAEKPKLACFPLLITGCECPAIKQIIKQQLKKEREQWRGETYQKVEN